MKTPFTDILNYVTSNGENPFSFGQSKQLQKELGIDDTAYISQGIIFAVRNNDLSMDDVINMFTLFFTGDMGENAPKYKEQEIDVFQMRGIYYTPIALAPRYRILDPAAITVQYLQDGSQGDGIDGFCMCFDFEREYMRFFIERISQTTNLKFSDSLMNFLEVDA